MTNKVRALAAAAYLGLSRSTLAKMRHRGDGPMYAKAGARVVVYDLRDLDAWLDASKRRSTSERLPEQPPQTNSARSDAGVKGHAR